MFTKADTEFRNMVQSFLARELPADLAEKTRRQVHLEREDIVRWHRILHQKGWSAPLWPREFGGPGWTTTERFIFDQECAEAGAPALEPNGTKMVGPVIYTFGSDAQKKRYLPRILSMQDWWCQGFSEPDAGSDLASLKTSAELRNGKFIVNGQKTWTTQAHFANMMYCLVRTDREAPKPQAGISFLLIDMASPGVTVRPIMTIDGAHNVNEVFLENVEVPAENLVGELNKGWTYAKLLLNLERTSIAQITKSKIALARLRSMAETCRAGTGMAAMDAGFGDRVAWLELDLIALEKTNLRVLAAENAGRDPGPEASVLKIRGSELQQDILELTCEVLGPRALPLEPHHASGNAAASARDATAASNERYLYSLATSIYGGSNEVLRNLIAKSVVGV